MRRITHLLIGALAFLPYAYLLDLAPGIPSRALLAGFFTTLLGSVIPDALEPAWTRNHRGILHSRRAMRIATLAFALTAITGLLQALSPGLSPFTPVSCFFLGYALHLGADGMTPAGLPG